MITHTLKCTFRSFAALRCGDVRYVLQRHNVEFNAGDGLLLREYNGVLHQYTGWELRFVVTHVLTAERSGGALSLGYCLLGVRPAEETSDAGTGETVGA